jgi:sucrose-phosphate synthase
MAGGSQQVLMSVMKLIDQYDLYGNVAYPKHHSQVGGRPGSGEAASH